MKIKTSGAPSRRCRDGRTGAAHRPTEPGAARREGRCDRPRGEATFPRSCSLPRGIVQLPRHPSGVSAAPARGLCSNRQGGCAAPPQGERHAPRGCRRRPRSVAQDLEGASKEYQRQRRSRARCCATDHGGFANPARSCRFPREGASPIPDGRVDFPRGGFATPRGPSRRAPRRRFGRIPLSAAKPHEVLRDMDRGGFAGCPPGSCRLPHEGFAIPHGRVASPAGGGRRRRGQWRRGRGGWRRSAGGERRADGSERGAAGGGEAPLYEEGGTRTRTARVSSSSAARRGIPARSCSTATGSVFTATRAALPGKLPDVGRRCGRDRSAPACPCWTPRRAFEGGYTGGAAR